MALLFYLPRPDCLQRVFLPSSHLALAPLQGLPGGFRTCSQVWCCGGGYNEGLRPRGAPPRPQGVTCAVIGLLDHVSRPDQAVGAHRREAPTQGCHLPRGDESPGVKRAALLCSRKLRRAGSQQACGSLWTRPGLHIPRGSLPRPMTWSWAPGSGVECQGSILPAEQKFGPAGPWSWLSQHCQRPLFTHRLP